MKPASPEAMKLMFDGAKALAAVEAAGIRVDVDYLDRTIDRVGRWIDEFSASLKGGDEWRTWQRVYRGKANLGSRPQLGRVLFKEMGYEGKKTDKGNWITSASALERLDIQFVKDLLRIEKLKKLQGTYLKGIRREVVDGRIHPFYNLHLVTTYRSSSDSPNFQNVPVRDREIGKLVRRAFVPSRGNVLVEIDYGSIEVRVAACYHRDPTMLEYIESGYDMHRDMAAECYRLREDQVTKDVRYCAKNKFVFPQFYGSYHVDCARDLRGAIRQMKLGTEDGTSLEEHLEAEGIWKRKDFENHIKHVEDRFWNERFPVYARWKDDWLKQYYERGWFRTKTGFVCQGIYKRNEAINYPIQGSAYDPNPMTIYQGAPPVGPWLDPGFVAANGESYFYRHSEPVRIFVSRFGDTVRMGW